MRHLSLADYLKASSPTLAAVVSKVTIDHINAGLTTVSISLGIAYLLWKWRKEARSKNTEK